MYLKGLLLVILLLLAVRLGHQVYADKHMEETLRIWEEGFGPLDDRFLEAFPPRENSPEAEEYLALTKILWSSSNYTPHGFLKNTFWTRDESRLLSDPNLNAFLEMHQDTLFQLNDFLIERNESIVFERNLENEETIFDSNVEAFHRDLIEAYYALSYQLKTNGDLKGATEALSGANQMNLITKKQLGILPELSYSRNRLWIGKTLRNIHPGPKSLTLFEPDLIPLPDLEKDIWVEAYWARQSILKNWKPSNSTIFGNFYPKRFHQHLISDYLAPNWLGKSYMDMYYSKNFRQFLLIKKGQIGSGPCGDKVIGEFPSQGIPDWWATFLPILVDVERARTTLTDWHFTVATESIWHAWASLENPEAVFSWPEEEWTAWLNESGLDHAFPCEKNYLAASRKDGKITITLQGPRLIDDRRQWDPTVTWDLSEVLEFKERRNTEPQ